MLTTKPTLGMTIALLALAAAPADAASQDRVAVLEGPNAAVSLAEALEARAWWLTRGRPRWKRAADLYLRAARLRGPGQFRAAEDLHLAASLYFYADRPSGSVRAHRHAGEAFLALGDVKRAARAFLDGAWVAAEAGMPLEGRELLERARPGLFRADARSYAAHGPGGVPRLRLPIQEPPTPIRRYHT